MLEYIQQASNGVVREEIGEKLKLSSEVPFRVEELNVEKAGPNLSAITLSNQHSKLTQIRLQRNRYHHRLITRVHSVHLITLTWKFSEIYPRKKVLILH